jgi:hypothetical protein
LPGHGRPFHHLNSRIEQIESDIASQLAHIVQRLGSGPASAYELLSAGTLLDRRPIAVRYQVSLVLARLRFLERRGRVHAIEGEGILRYALVE